MTTLAASRAHGAALKGETHAYVPLRTHLLVLGFGSRHLDEADAGNRALVMDALVSIGERHPNVALELEHGGAPGADTLFAESAGILGWAVTAYAADWDGPCSASCKHKKRRMRADGTTWCPGAGWRRNWVMIARRPRYAIGIRAEGAPNKGTSGMINELADVEWCDLEVLVGARKSDS
jgi:hypothetical protein